MPFAADVAQTTAWHNLPPVLSAKQVQALMQVGRRALDRWIAAGKFPAPMRHGIGRGVLRWRRETLEAFLLQKEGRGRARGLRKGRARQQS
jgi:predicted DNA-binding transcriptional regulator AlpA